MSVGVGVSVGVSDGVSNTKQTFKKVRSSRKRLPRLCPSVRSQGFGCNLRDVFARSP